MHNATERTSVNCCFVIVYNLFIHTFLALQTIIAWLHQIASKSDKNFARYFALKHPGQIDRQTGRQTDKQENKVITYPPFTVVMEAKHEKKTL